jgi:transcriptional regulator
MTDPMDQTTSTTIYDVQRRALEQIDAERRTLRIRNSLNLVVVATKRGAQRVIRPSPYYDAFCV